MLEQEEQSIDQLEQKLEKILKICTSMIETGKTYVGQQRFDFSWCFSLSLEFFQLQSVCQ